MKKINLIVQNPHGIHARPASAISNLANQFKSKIMFVSDEAEINAKSIMGILTLGASKGTSITIWAEGQDEENAIEALRMLFGRNFKEQ